MLHLSCGLQIPSFRADPLQKECDTWCEFPVKDRANAVMQWIMAVEKEPSMLKGAWLLMLESDYVWVKPMMVSGQGQASALLRQRRQGQLAVAPARSACCRMMRLVKLLPLATAHPGPADNAHACPMLRQLELCSCAHAGAG